MAIEIDKETEEEDRLGKVTIRRRYLCDTKQEARTGLPSAVEGLVRVGRRASPWISTTDGRYIADAVYEGVFDDPDETFDEYELLTEEREMPIETFKPIEDLLEEYNGSFNNEGNKINFQSELATQRESRIGRPITLDAMKESRIYNPMFGVTTYPATHTVATWRLVRKRVPQSLIKQERTVIDRLPSGFDYSGPKKNWYVRPLQKRKSGNAWTVEWSAFEVSEFQHMEALFALQNRKG